MNILQHIEAGHYPVDSKGRALVKMRDGRTAVILATDNPNSHDLWPVIALILGDCVETFVWAETGTFHLGMRAGHDPRDLLPPPPRKVPVEGWACVWTSHPFGKATIGWSKENLIRDAGPDPDGTRYRIVPLTGSYEEEWT